MHNVISIIVKHCG